MDKLSRKAWMRGNIDQLKFPIQTGLSRYTRTQNVQSSSFYPHKTLAFDATDPNSICRMFAYDLADEGFTFVTLAVVHSSRRRADARKFSFRNSWRWPIYILISDDKTKLCVAGWLMICQRNCSKSLRFESSSWGIKIFSIRMFVTNTCHPSLKICFLNDGFTGLLMQQVLLFPHIFSDILFQLSLQIQIKGAWKGC